MRWLIAFILAYSLACWLRWFLLARHYEPRFRLIGTREIKQAWRLTTVTNYGKTLFIATGVALALLVAWASCLWGWICG